jgi:hypothetical protein
MMENAATLYLLLLGAIALAAFAANAEGTGRRYAWLLWTFGVLLMLFAGLRSNQFSDYANYVNMYKQLAAGNTVTVEPSYHIIAWLVREVLGNNTLYLFAIYAIIGISLKLIAIRRLTELWLLSLAVYASSYFILHDCIQIRAAVASGFLLLCIKPLAERRGWRFLLFAASAALFHLSALAVLPLWLMKNNRLNRWLFALLIPVGYLMWAANIDILAINGPIEYVQEKIVMYRTLKTSNVGDYAKINVFNLVYLAKILMYYLLLWKYNLVAANNKYACLLMKIWGISLFSFTAFSFIPGVAFRIHELLGIVEVILIPLLYYVVRPKPIARLCVVAVGVALALIVVFYNGLIA